VADLQRALGQAFRAARERRGMTQAAVAELAGLERTYLTDLERGRRNPTITTLERLSRALGVRLADLFAEIEGGP